MADVHDSARCVSLFASVEPGRGLARRGSKVPPPAMRGQRPLGAQPSGRRQLPRVRKAPGHSLLRRVARLPIALKMGEHAADMLLVLRTVMQHILVPCNIMQLAAGRPNIVPYFIRVTHLETGTPRNQEAVLSHLSIAYGCQDGGLHATWQADILIPEPYPSQTRCRNPLARLGRVQVASARLTLERAAKTTARRPTETVPHLPFARLSVHCHHLRS